MIAIFYRFQFNETFSFYFTIIFCSICGIILYKIIFDYILLKIYKTTFSKQLKIIKEEYPLMIVMDEVIYFGNILSVKEDGVIEVNFSKFTYFIDSGNMRITDELWLTKDDLVFINFYGKYYYNVFYKYILNHKIDICIIGGEYSKIDNLKHFLENGR